MTPALPPGKLGRVNEKVNVAIVFELRSPLGITQLCRVAVPLVRKHSQGRSVAGGESLLQGQPASLCVSAAGGAKRRKRRKKPSSVSLFVSVSGSHPALHGTHQFCPISDFMIIGNTG